MMTVTSVVSKMTDPSVVLQNVYDTLREIDPEFREEERKYKEAVAASLENLGDSVVPSAAEYIAAVEKQISAELVYTGWLGFQLNLDCFKNPVNALILKGDYEDIHRERRMHTLPGVQEALKVINAFHEATRNLPDEKRGVTEGITDFVCYLETTGYKLAHYFGFLLADNFLHHVIPGYTKDSLTTSIFAWGLEEYMKLNLKPML